MAYQSTNNIFLSHKTSQQYFQPWLISQTSPNEQSVIESSTPTLLNETLGPELARNHMVLPATGTAGGILLAAADRYFQFNPMHTTAHTISAKITMLDENKS